MKVNNIKPGDLVIWVNEAKSGQIQEVGVVTSIENSVPGAAVLMKGARIIWEHGVYWSPLDQVMSVKEYEKNNQKG